MPMSQIGIKRNIHVAGVRFPGIQISEPETVMVTTSQGRNIPSTFADVVSLRTPNPDGANAGGEPYLRVSRENLGFTTLRQGYVTGLDVDANGTLIDLQTLEDIRSEAILQRQMATRPAPTASVPFEVSVPVTAE